MDPNLSLCDAVEKGDLPALKLALAQGADPDFCGRFAQAPLARAARAQRWELMDELLLVGADPNQPDSESGWTPWLLAAAGGHALGMELLARRGVDPLFRNEKGLDAAMLASFHGHPKCLALAASLGADLERFTPDGDHCAGLACQGRELQCLVLLAELGVDVERANPMGLKPIDLARVYQNWRHVDFIIALRERREFDSIVPLAPSRAARPL